MSALPQGRKRARQCPTKYTVACLCPMDVELAPLQAMLDTEHESLPMISNHNAYVLGEIGGHNVVICVPASIGTNDSAVAAARIQQDFPAIRFYLLVGIAGGIPSASNDVRLGDVIVSMPTGMTGGVIQFDRGRSQTAKTFEVRGHLNKPPACLLSHVKSLQGLHRQMGDRISNHIRDMLRRFPAMKCSYDLPAHETDILFESTYLHEGDSTCNGCLRSRAIERPRRSGQRHQVHYGTIGSSNCILRDAIERDRLGQTLGLLAVETEAAGVMDSFPCLVIRGVCDYADSHKHKIWQSYAAATAAAYAKELLQIIPPLCALDCIPVNKSNSNQDGHVWLRSGPITSSESAGLMPPSLKTSTNHADTYQALLNSLEFDQMGARIRNVSDPMIKTCTWLLDNPIYNDWLRKNKQQDHHGFLWIRGKPGSGKSTLMKAALHWMKKRQKRETFISYFFNARGYGDLEKSPLGCYRSFTDQLIKATSGLGDVFVEEFSSKQRAGKIEPWTVIELQNFLKLAVRSHLKQPLNLFVDALDEGDDIEVRQMVSFFEELAQEASNAPSSFKICLSTRHYPNITTRRSLSLVVEDQPGHAADIKLYINSKLTFDQSSQSDELLEQLYQKSAGVFLWVVLVIRILNQASDTGQSVSYADCFDDIPAELDDLYARILTRTDVGRNQCATLLLWVAFSRRPLSPEEAFVALQLNFSENISRDGPPTSDEALLRYLIHCSRGLIEVTTGEAPVVQFIHETTRDYLRSKGGLALLLPNFAARVESKGHDFLKKACNRFLFQATFRDATSSMHKRSRYGPVQIASIQKNELLLEYATNNIFWHAMVAETNGATQTSFLAGFVGIHSVKRLTWIRLYNAFQKWKTRMYSDASLLYILAEQGYAPLVQAAIPIDGDIDRICEERHGTALQAACAVGCKDTVQVLIKAGADVNIRAGERQCPLITAFYGKSIQVIRLLIAHKANIPINEFEDILFVMVMRKFYPVLQILMDLGIDINCRNHREESPLYLACRNQNIEMCRWLIQRGADVNATCGFGNNVLGAALARYRECPKIVELLLNSSANPEASCSVFRSALQTASYYGSDRGVQLLLEQSVDVNVQGGIYGNALSTASSQGCCSIVQLLLENGAHVNAQGGFHTNALSAASAGGHSLVVKLLLRSGADINAQGGPFGNAIHAAIACGHPKIVKLLLESGADVNAQRPPLRDAIQAAIAGGYLRVGESLIALQQSSVIINTQSGVHINALQAAISFRQPYMVQLLVDNGADINLRNPCGESPLQIAQMTEALSDPSKIPRATKVVEILVTNGATE